MMNLYDIDQRITDYIESAVDPETGEIGDISGLDELEMERDRKIENIACYIKSLNSEASAIKAEIDELNKRMKGKQKKADRLSGYLCEALQGRPFESARCKITYRRSTKVEVANEVEAREWLESNGYDDFVKYAEPTVSKTGIARLLKSGEAVPGTCLVESVNMGVK